jgi:hypothetical protein
MTFFNCIAHESFISTREILKTTATCLNMATGYEVSKSPRPADTSFPLQQESNFSSDDN